MPAQVSIIGHWNYADRIIHRHWHYMHDMVFPNKLASFHTSALRSKNWCTGTPFVQECVDNCFGHSLVKNWETGNFSRGYLDSFTHLPHGKHKPYCCINIFSWEKSSSCSPYLTLPPPSLPISLCTDSACCYVVSDRPGRSVSWHYGSQRHLHQRHHRRIWVQERGFPMRGLHKILFYKSVLYTIL